MIKTVLSDILGDNICYLKLEDKSHDNFHAQVQFDWTQTIIIKLQMFFQV